MIWKLVLKDFKAFGTQQFIFLILFIALNSFMAANDENGSWWLFILITSGGVSILIPFTFVMDRNFKGSLLSSSLPVSRKQIVISKFLLSVVLSAIGCFAIFIAATLLTTVLNFNDFFLFSNAVMLLITASYFLLFSSISILFVTAIKNTIWLIIADVLFLVIFILGFEKIFLPGGFSADTVLSGIDYILMMFWIVLLIVAVTMALKLSIINYSKMDL